MTPEEVNKKYGYGKPNKSNNYLNHDTYTRYETKQNNIMLDSKKYNYFDSKKGVNMSITKQKNIVGVVVFLILQVMFLFSHFSIAGCINTIFVLLYLVIKNVVKNNTNEDLSIRFGNYIGVSFLNIMLIQLFQFIKLETIEAFVESEYIGVAIGVLIGSLVLLAGYAILGSFITKKGPITAILKYLVLFFILFPILNYLMPFEEIGNVCIFSIAVYLVVFLVLDIFEGQILNTYDKTILISTVFSSTVFVLIACINPEYTKKVLYGFTHLGSLNNLKWYTVAIIALIFIVAAIVCFVLDNNQNPLPDDKGREKNTIFAPNDTINLLLVGFDIVCFAIGIKYYTKYIAIFAVILFAINLIILLIPFKTRKKDFLSEKIFSSKFICELVLMAVLVILFFGYVNGILDICIIPILTLIVAIAMFDNKFVYNIIFLMLGIWACDIAYHYHNSPKVFTLIIFVTILFSLAIFLLGLRNKKIISEDYRILQCIVGIFAFIIMVTPMFHTGVKISTDVENSITSVDANVGEVLGEKNSVVVKLKPHGKENNVSKCVYYWNSDKNTVVTPKLSEDNTFTIDGKQDNLIIVCTDSNGVVSKYSHYFNIK